jgi:sulfoxide reductase catalytic subunit YedY
MDAVQRHADHRLLRRRLHRSTAGVHHRVLQAPAIASRFGLGWDTVMVYITGLLVNLNHITTGMNTAAWTGLWLYVIWMTVVVVAWFTASPLTLRYPRVAQRTGRLLVGRAKWLLEWGDPRATYPERAISPFFWPNGTLPTSQAYADLRNNGFRDYTLRVDGLVENPTILSFDQLKAMPKQEQITQHYCIQGWSGIAKWGGADARHRRVGPATATGTLGGFYSFARGAEGDATTTLTTSNTWSTT